MAEAIYNKWLQLVRSRVEHLNSVVKQHQMFKGEPYRGWVKNLSCFVKITLHASAAEIRQREKKNGAPRYAGYGWWPHHKHPPEPGRAAPVCLHGARPIPVWLAVFRSV